MKVNFGLNCGFYSKTGNWVLFQKRDNVSNSGLLTDYSNTPDKFE